MPPTLNPKKRPAKDAPSTSTAAKGQAFRKSASASKKARLGGAEQQQQNKLAQSQSQSPPLKSAMKKAKKESAAKSTPKPQVSIAASSKAKSSASKGKSDVVQVKSKPTQEKAKVPKAAEKSSTASSSTSFATTQMSWIHPPTPLPTFRIMTGSYERLLYGVKVTQSSTSSASSLDLDLKPIFQFPAHPSSIKCLATGGAASKYLVTAGQDELVKIWDLRRKKEIGSLSGAESHGAPIAFEFPLASHLLLTAEGVILLYRTRDWALLHTFKGHTGRVNFVSTHPSARLALSGGQDGVLRAWDLMRGKPFGGTKMGMGHGGEMERLAWFGDNKGLFFALLGRTVVRIFRKSMAEVARIGEGTLTSTRLNDVAVWDLGEEAQGKSLIFVAREDKRVGVYLFEKAVFDELDKQAEEEDENADDDDEEERRTLKEVAWLTGHDSRVKAVSLQPLATSADSSSTLTATTISSDGNIRIFNLHDIIQAALADTLDASTPLSITPSGVYSTKGARLTCLSTTGGDGTMRGSRAEGDYDDDEEEDEEDEDGAGATRPRGAPSEDESDFVSDFDDGEAVDEESELKKLEDMLREAKAQGIDLDLLVSGGLDVEGSDDGDDDDEEEEEEEEEDD